jgi:hypothetical protein
VAVRAIINLIAFLKTGCTNFLLPSFSSRNSLITSLNFGYDHGDYRERVDKDQLFLVKYDLGDMYEDTTITGFVE